MIHKRHARRQHPRPRPEKPARPFHPTQERTAPARFIHPRSYARSDHDDTYGRAYRRLKREIPGLKRSAFMLIAGRLTDWSALADCVHAAINLQKALSAGPRRFIRRRKEFSVAEYQYAIRMQSHADARKPNDTGTPMRFVPSHIATGGVRPIPKESIGIYPIPPVCRTCGGLAYGVLTDGGWKPCPECGPGAKQ